MSPLSGYRDADEEARLHALHALGVLDSEPEPRLQVLVDRAARTFRVPMAALGFVDRERVWIKAAVGFDGRELPRGIAFCAHLLHRHEPMVVKDALQDPRFARNPLVVGPLHIRFYAGAAVRSASGHAVGSLCILDVVPRELSEIDRQHLSNMAHYAANELMVREFVRYPGR
jgi:GAF domain-containing protein